MMHKLAVCPLFQIPQSWCSHILYTSTMRPCKSNTHLSRRSCTSAVIVLSISCTLSTCSKALCQKIGYNKLIELSISNSWYLLLVLSFYTPSCNAMGHTPPLQPCHARQERSPLESGRISLPSPLGYSARSEMVGGSAKMQIERYVTLHIR